MPKINKYCLEVQATVEKIKIYEIILIVYRKCDKIV